MQSLPFEDVVAGTAYKVAFLDREFPVDLGLARYFAA